MASDQKTLTTIDDRDFLRRIDPPTEQEMASIAACPSLTSVYRLMIQWMEARLDGRITDKAIAMYLDMDTGQFSRAINHGQVGLTPENELKLMRLCGSGAPVYWRLYHMGLDATTVEPLETELERQNRELREQIARLNQDLQSMTRLAQERIGGAAES